MGTATVRRFGGSQVRQVLVRGSWGSTGAGSMVPGSRVPGRGFSRSGTREAGSGKREAGSGKRMMKRLLLTLVAFVAIVVTPSGQTPARPQRIISLVPALTEMLFAVGAGPQVIAVSSF